MTYIGKEIQVTPARGPCIDHIAFMSKNAETRLCLSHHTGNWGLSLPKAEHIMLFLTGLS